jgi:hypothetical protein
MKSEQAVLPNPCLEEEEEEEEEEDKTKGSTVVLYILIFKFPDRRQEDKRLCTEW